MAHKAGVKRISEDVYHQVRQLTLQTLNAILQAVITYTEHAKRRTVSLADVTHALARLKLVTYVGEEKIKKRASKCKSRSRKKYGSKVKHPSRKAHRYKPGTQALRSIRFRQKQNDCVHFSPTVFTRLVRELANNFQYGLQFQVSAINMIQYAIEGYLVKVLEYANVIAINAKRSGIASKDVQTALKIMNG